MHFNAFILKLENKLSNEEILTHSRGYIRSKYKASEENDFYKRYSRVAYGLLDNNAQSLGAKKNTDECLRWILYEKWNQ